MIYTTTGASGTSVIGKIVIDDVRNVELLSTSGAKYSSVTIREGYSTPEIYYTDTENDLIGRITLSGDEQVTILSSDDTETVSEPLGIYYDETNEMLYWTTSTDYSVNRANATGGDVYTLVKGIGSATAITGNDQYIFFATSTGDLYRLDLDGDDLQLLHGFDLDITGLQTTTSSLTGDTLIYLSFDSKIVRYNLNTGGSKVLVSGLSDCDSLAIDTTNRLIYYTQESDARISIASFTGSDRTMLTEVVRPDALAYYETRGSTETLDASFITFHTIPPTTLVLTAGEDTSSLGVYVSGTSSSATSEVGGKFVGSGGSALAVHESEAFWISSNSKSVLSSSLDEVSVSSIFTTDTDLIHDLALVHDTLVVAVGAELVSISLSDDDRTATTLMALDAPIRSVAGFHALNMAIVATASKSVFKVFLGDAPNSMPELVAETSDLVNDLVVDQGNGILYAISATNLALTSLVVEDPSFAVIASGFSRAVGGDLSRDGEYALYLADAGNNAVVRVSLESTTLELVATAQNIADVKVVQRASSQVSVSVTEAATAQQVLLNEAERTAEPSPSGFAYSGTPAVLALAAVGLAVGAGELYRRRQRYLKQAQYLSID